MRLYNIAASGNCYKVRLLAAQLGLQLDIHDMAPAELSNRQAAIGKLTPVERLPVLVLDNGRALIESAAIVDYLAEGTHLMPSDRFDRAQALAWQFFEQHEVGPNVDLPRLWKRFGIEVSAEQREGRMAAGRKTLAALERGLAGKEWLVADAYSVADICVYAYTHLAPESGYDLEPFPWIRAWLDRVAAQPGHVTMLD